MVQILQEKRYGAVTGRGRGRGHKQGLGGRIQPGQSYSAEELEVDNRQTDADDNAQASGSSAPKYQDKAKRGRGGHRRRGGGRGGYEGRRHQMKIFYWKLILQFPSPLVILV